MKFDAIIFDYDGVIADSELLLHNALSCALTTIGLPTSVDESLRDFGGRRWRDMLPIIEARYGAELPAAHLGQQIENIASIVMAQVKPLPGIEVFLHLTRDFPRAIAASGDIIWITKTMARFGIADHFEGRVFSSSTMPNGKPQPDVFLHAARQLGHDPTRCVAIEDSIVGVTAAVAAGMTVIGFTAASHIKDGDGAALLAAGAAIVTADFEDIADWIEIDS